MDTDATIPPSDHRHSLLVRLLPRTVRGSIVTGLVLSALACCVALYATIRQGAHAQPTRPADVILVLGAGSELPGPRPKPVYQSRLRYARDLWQRGFAPHVIVTERSPAAEAAREYLIGLGVPQDAVALENRSATTRENLAFARDLMRSHAWRGCIIVSDGFHLSRALRMSRDLGLDAQGAATPYSLIELLPVRRVKYTLREVPRYAAYLLVGH
jgi:uncharacterized SAM-binding protein YcdF (DUF218 family)